MAITPLDGTDRRGDGRDTADTPVKREPRAEFDLPGRLSDPAAERDLDDALDLLVAEEFDRAAERLATEFTTSCEGTVPEFTDHGGGHRSACLRNRAGDRVRDSAPHDD